MHSNQDEPVREKPFSEILSRLTTPPLFRCEHPVGMASFLDETEYQALGDQFEKAVQILSSAYGQPSRTRYVIPQEDVEKLVCWDQPPHVLFALLSFGDNTRIRILTLGVRNAGDMIEDHSPRKDPWSD